MRIIARTPKEANHKGDIVTLWYQDHKLISGSNDENIKVRAHLKIEKGINGTYIN